VDVAKASVLTTLKAKSWVEGLAFSPDGKWLAVATRPSIPAGETPASGTPAELVVFDVPAFTARSTAKAGSPENGFVELAWAPDGKSLHAIDGPVGNASGKAKVRRWDVPAFTEQPAARALQLKGPAALAVSPDGHTLALSFGEGETNALLLRLFDVGGGDERSFRAGDPFRLPRLGFTADGKAVGVFDTNRLSWWDVATGRPAEPRAARFAVQPAGLSGYPGQNAVSPDGAWVAQGYDRHRGLGDLGWDNREGEFGGFVKVTQSATAKTWTWRVSRAQEPPGAVAFSPDGTRLAGTVRQPSGGGSILIWAVPK
jgi:WD40 repeat protein